MQSNSWSIWIVTALVLVAMLDRVPDPPAANPDLVQFRISSVHEVPVAFGTPPPSAIPAFRPSERFIPLVVSEPAPASKTIDSLERATDPSPPLLLM